MTSRTTNNQYITDACLTYGIDVRRAGCPLQHFQAWLARHPVANKPGRVGGSIVLLEDNLLAPGSKTLVGGQEVFLQQIPICGGCYASDTVEWPAAFAVDPSPDVDGAAAALLAGGDVLRRVPLSISPVPGKYIYDICKVYLMKSSIWHFLGHYSINIVLRSITIKAHTFSVSPTVRSISLNRLMQIYL